VGAVDPLTHDIDFLGHADPPWYSKRDTHIYPDDSIDRQPVGVGIPYYPQFYGDMSPGPYVAEIPYPDGVYYTDGYPVVVFLWQDEVPGDVPCVPYSILFLYTVGIVTPA
jgi:hypothetical protein